jgi:methylphosphotriester-DNA--protein-cysteine methyltransferase
MMTFLKNTKIIIGMLVIVLTLAVSQASFANTYVANASTGKFHYEDCRWVDKMSDSNKIYFNSRDEAIDAGYVPCKVCKP